MHRALNWDAGQWKQWIETLVVTAFAGIGLTLPCARGIHTHGSDQNIDTHMARGVWERSLGRALNNRVTRRRSEPGWCAIILLRNRTQNLGLAKLSRVCTRVVVSQISKEGRTSDGWW